MTQRPYKPGDKPPQGYTAWHEWADVQRKAGIKQRQCEDCGLWLTPQEVAGHIAEHAGIRLLPAGGCEVQA